MRVPLPEKASQPTVQFDAEEIEAILQGPALDLKPWPVFANGRLMNEDVNISLHTMALIRGGRIGAVMYYAKAYYGFEILGNKEWWATYESYNGWARWGVGMAQPSYPWPDGQHELGGARVYYVTKKYWDRMVKKYVQQMTGSELDFNVPDEVIKANEVMRVPEEVLV